MNEMLSLSTDPTTMSPVALFLQADLVVKGVMVLLLLASVWTWAIIIASMLRTQRLACSSRTVMAHRLRGHSLESVIAPAQPRATLRPLPQKVIKGENVALRRDHQHEQQQNKPRDDVFMEGV